MTSTLLRVAVLGESELVVLGLRSILAEVATVDVAHAAERPEVCLVDPFGDLAERLGVGPTLDLARRTAPRVLACTWDPARARGLRLDGVIPKAGPSEEIVRLVLASERRDATTLPAGLEPIAAMLLDGHTNDEIARTLHLSRSTTTRRLGDLYRHLGVTNRVGAVTRLATDGRARPQRLTG